MTIEQDNKPISFPVAWPSDGRSKMNYVLGHGWVLQHRQRDPVIFKDGKWQPFLMERGVA